MRRVRVAAALALAGLTACSPQSSAGSDPSPLGAPAGSAAVAQGGADWTTYHADPARTGVASRVPPPGRLSVA
ncbi:MAG: hypothetical protein QOE54_3185, partial [Streptosporangiaceae bacterium]|nr:hypothetical protein [Streptosporangiaceae bacterium]